MEIFDEDIIRNLFLTMTNLFQLLLRQQRQRQQQVKVSNQTFISHKVRPKVKYAAISFKKVVQHFNKQVTRRKRR
jgi:hypothetical protein